MVALLFILPYIALSMVKTEWSPQHRYTLMFGLLILPYAAGAIRVFSKQRRIGAIVSSVLLLTVATQAAAYHVHSRLYLPVYDYNSNDVVAWKWLAANVGSKDALVVEDTDWRSYGLLSHSGLYTHPFSVVYSFDPPTRLAAILSSNSHPIVMVLHSPLAKWDFIDPLNPAVVFRNGDYTILRLSSEGPRPVEDPLPR